MFTFLLMCLSQSDSESSPLFWRGKKKKNWREKIPPNLEFHAYIPETVYSNVFDGAWRGASDTCTVCNENLLKKTQKMIFDMKQ